MKALALPLLLLLVSCDPPPPAPKPVAKPKSQAAEHAATLAWAIEGGLKRGDPSAFDNSCDLDAFVKRVIGYTPVTDGMRACIAKVIKGDPDFSRINVLNSWIEGLRGWRFLFVRPHGTSPRPVFRAIDHQGFPVYVEMHLEPALNALPRIVDLTLSATGEPVSEYVRRTYLPPPEAWERLSQLRAPMIADLLHARGPIVAPLLTEYYAAERCAEFETHFERHRESLRNEKSVHVARMRLAIAAKPGALGPAFEDFEKGFPGDPSLEFWRILAMEVQGRWEEALAAVEVIDRDLKDPFLDAIRSRLHTGAGRLDKAGAFAKKCTDAEPSLADGWYARVALALPKKDARAAGLLLATADKVATIELKRLQALAGFDAFEATDEGRTWMKSRSSR